MLLPGSTRGPVRIEIYPPFEGMANRHQKAGDEFYRLFKRLLAPTLADAL